jgi:hypothetical protein
MGSVGRILSFVVYVALLALVWAIMVILGWKVRRRLLASLSLDSRVNDASVSSSVVCGVQMPYRPSTRVICMFFVALAVHVVVVSPVASLVATYLRQRWRRTKAFDM